MKIFVRTLALLFVIAILACGMVACKKDDVPNYSSQMPDDDDYVGEVQDVADDTVKAKKLK